MLRRMPVMIEGMAAGMITRPQQLRIVGPHHDGGLMKDGIDLMDTVRRVDGSWEERTQADQEDGRRVSDAEKRRATTAPTR